MQVALSETIVEGINTNISLHRELLNDENFISGDFSINFLEDKFNQSAFPMLKKSFFNWII